MNSEVRIIKRDRAAILQDAPLKTTPRQSDREIANAVKIWITELAQRRRADEHNALAFKIRGHAG